MYKKIPYFIKWGYVWKYNGIPKNERTSLMRQTWDIVKENYISNRIHVEDLSGIVIKFLIEKHDDTVVNVSDQNLVKNYVHKKQMLSGYLRKMQEFIYSIIVIGTLLYLPFKIVFY